MQTVPRVRLGPKVKMWTKTMCLVESVLPVLQAQVVLTFLGPRAQGACLDGLEQLERLEQLRTRCKLQGQKALLEEHLELMAVCLAELQEPVLV